MPRTRNQVVSGPGAPECNPPISKHITPASDVIGDLAYALDTLRNSVGALASGLGRLPRSRRLHPHRADSCARCALHSALLGPPRRLKPPNLPHGSTTPCIEATCTL